MNVKKHNSKSSRKVYIAHHLNVRPQAAKIIIFKQIKIIVNLYFINELKYKKLKIENKLWVEFQKPLTVNSKKTWWIQ